MNIYVVALFTICQVVVAEMSAQRPQNGSSVVVSLVVVRYYWEPISVGFKVLESCTLVFAGQSLVNEVYVGVAQHQANDFRSPVFVVSLKVDFAKVRANFSSLHKLGHLIFAI